MKGKGINGQVPTPDKLLELFQYCASFGPVVQMPDKQPLYLVNDPASIQRILETNSSEYSKQNTAFALQADLLGQGLLTTSGEDWQQDRQVVQPLFHGKNLSHYLPIMQQMTQDMLQYWQPKKTVNLWDDCRVLSMRLSGRLFLGIDITASLATQLLAKMDQCHEIIAKGRPLRRFAFRPSHRRFYRHKKFLDKTLSALLAERLNAAPPAIMAPLLTDATDKALLDQLKNIFWAGYETTGAALAWSGYLLGQNPDWQSVLATEAKEQYHTHPLTIESLAEMKQTQWVFQESLRLYPPVWFYERYAKTPDKLSDAWIPEGARLMICTYTLHRDPNFWREPEKFEPGRFMPQRTADRPRFTFLPYGIGPRVCVGKQFAQLVAKIVLAEMFSQFRLQNVHKNIEPQGGAVLRPNKSLLVRLSRSDE